jgi:hypothetical protein
MKRILVSLALATTLAWALAIPAVAADPARPVTGTFTGAGIQVAQTCSGALTLGFAIEGVLGHLGRIAGVGTNCTEFTLGFEAVDIWDGSITLTAADGSTLTTSYAGGQGEPSNGIATFWHSHDVIDGTGRFAGAAGELEVIGVIDFGTLIVSGTVSGWIAY